MQSRWSLRADQPGEVVELSGLWPPNGPRSLRFERASKRITERSLFGDVVEISFASLRGVRFVVGPATGKGLSLQLSLSSDEREETRTRSYFFQVSQVDKSEEALDLIFRIAQVLGWPSYVLHRKDEGGIDLELRPERDAPFRESQDTHQAPVIDEKADYQSTQSLYELMKRDTQRPRFREPASAEVFDPKAHAAVARWGDESILLQKERESGLIFSIIFLFVLLPMILFIALVIELFRLSLLFLACFFGMLIPMLIVNELIVNLGDTIFSGMVFLSILIPVAYFVLFRLPAYWRYLARHLRAMSTGEADLDLVNGTLTLRRARYFWSRWSLTSLSAITLSERPNNPFAGYLSKAERNKKREVEYEVRAKIGLLSLRLWETTDGTKDERRAAYSLAVALARVLDVPFREE